MPSPFPGMNPYLEHRAVWKDFHDSYVPALRDALQPLVVPAGFFVRIDEAVTVRDAWREDEEPVGRADLAVPQTGRHPGKPAKAAAVSASVVAELPRRTDTERLPYLEVLDRQRDQVVTVVELLSPSNKEPGADREVYLAKRRRLLAADVNYVEIDLLRVGRPMPLRRCPASEYRVMVSRAADRPRVEAWPVRLRDRLPVVPVPLRPGVPEPAVDLQAVLDRVYDAAMYAAEVYRRPIDPPLAPADAEWARSLVPSA
jgi:hypothetical protein